MGSFNKIVILVLRWLVYGNELVCHLLSLIVDIVKVKWSQFG